MFIGFVCRVEITHLTFVICGSKVNKLVLKLVFGITRLIYKFITSMY